MGVFDQGAEGRYRPSVLDSGALENIRDNVGMPPNMGQKWVMVNVMTGEVKWYKSSRRRFGSSRRVRR